MWCVLFFVWSVELLESFSRSAGVFDSFDCQRCGDDKRGKPAQGVLLKSRGS